MAIDLGRKEDVAEILARLDIPKGAGASWTFGFNAKSDMVNFSKDAKGWNHFIKVS